jgi:hypothetical protein
MPFKSEAQRRYMHANHPAIAKQWEAEEATEARKDALPDRVNGHKPTRAKASIRDVAKRLVNKPQQ